MYALFAWVFPVLVSVTVMLLVFGLPTDQVSTGISHFTDHKSSCI